jgi:MATE family multidrug resistance protein
VAAHQVALNWASLSFCFALGVGSAGAVRVGWAIGAGSVPAARRAGLVAFGLGALVMAVSAALFLWVPYPLARMMTDKPAVVVAAVALFGVTAVFQISDGIQAVGSGVLRGAGDTRFAFLANLVGHWAIGMPIAVWLGLVQGLGVTGLWWGLSAGLTAVAVALLWRFHQLTRPGSAGAARLV